MEEVRVVDRAVAEALAVEAEARVVAVEVQVEAVELVEADQPRAAGQDGLARVVPVVQALAARAEREQPARMPAPALV